MLDENGFIKIPEAGGIHPAFRPAVNHVVDMLTGRLGRVIHSLYLYGSVARGNAVAGQSDLDICLLLYQKAGAREARMLRVIASETERQQRAITKVDFDVGTLAEALNPDNLHRWGYWLKHHCRCLHGEDLRQRFPRFRPSRAIAFAVNGDFFTVLGGYIAKLREEERATGRQQLCRSAARKLIRSTNILRTDDDVDWPDSLEDHLQRFAIAWPAMADSLRYFYEQAHHPQDNAEHFIAQLSEFMMWLKGRARDSGYTFPPHFSPHGDPP